MAGMYNFYNGIKQNYKQQGDIAVAQIMPLTNGLIGQKVFELQKSKEAQKGIAEKKIVAGVMGVDTNLPAGIETPESAGQIFDYRANRLALDKTVNALATAYGIPTTDFADKDPETKKILVEKAIKDQINASADAEEKQKALDKFEEEKKLLAIKHGYNMEEIYGRANATENKPVKLTAEQQKRIGNADQTIKQLASGGKVYLTPSKKGSALVTVRQSGSLNKLISTAVIDGKEIAYDGVHFYQYKGGKWKPYNATKSANTAFILRNAYGDWIASKSMLGQSSTPTTAQPQEQTTTTIKRFNPVTGKIE